MSIKSKNITFLLLVVALPLILSGCGKGRAVPTEDEARKAIESHVRTIANPFPDFAIPQTAFDIDSFKQLEVYDHDYDFNKLAGKFSSKVDPKYLNVNKRHVQRRLGDRQSIFRAPLQKQAW